MLLWRNVKILLAIVRQPALLRDPVHSLYLSSPVDEESRRPHLSARKMMWSSSVFCTLCRIIFPVASGSVFPPLLLSTSVFLQAPGTTTGTLIEDDSFVKISNEAAATVLTADGGVDGSNPKEEPPKPLSAYTKELLRGVRRAVSWDHYRKAEELGLLPPQPPDEDSASSQQALNYQVVDHSDFCAKDSPIIFRMREHGIRLLQQKYRFHVDKYRRFRDKGVLTDGFMGVEDSGKTLGLYPQYFPDEVQTAWYAWRAKTRLARKAVHEIGNVADELFFHLSGADSYSGGRLKLGKQVAVIADAADEGASSSENGILIRDLLENHDLVREPVRLVENYSMSGRKSLQPYCAVCPSPGRFCSSSGGQSMRNLTTSRGAHGRKRMTA